MSQNLNERLNECLFGTSITLKFLERTVQQIFKTASTFGPQHSTERIGLRQGHLSVMVRIIFDWQGSDIECLPQSLVLKIPSVAIYSKAELEVWEPIIRMAHPTEVNFYNLINEANAAGLGIPRCFASQDFGPNGQPGFLLLEDLCDTAAIKSMYDGLSVDALKQVMESFASLHALSVKHVDLQQYSQRLKSNLLEMYNKDIPSAKARLLEDIRKLTEPHIEYFGPCLKQLCASVVNNNQAYSANEIYRELDIPLVLVHGDMHMFNLMWKKTGGETETSDELVAIVDWQNTHLGTVSEDLVHLLCTSVSPQIRRAHFDELIDHYLSSLAAKLGGEPPFTKEQIKISFWRFVPFALSMLFIIWRAFSASGLLGPHDQERKRQLMLDRCRCTLEDWCKFSDDIGADQ